MHLDDALTMDQMSQHYPTNFKSSANATCLTLDVSIVPGLTASNKGVIPMAYTGIARGSPWVVPSDDRVSTPPKTNRRDGKGELFD